MNITTLVQALRDATVTDSTTETWCESNYTQAHQVQVGADTRKPPASDEYPLVVIFPVRKVAGYELIQSDHIIGVSCGLYDDTKTETAVGDVTRIDYAGIANIETFRKKVEDAITTEVDGDTTLGRIDNITIDYDPLEFFPFFFATMEIRLVHDYAQGDDPFA